MELHSNAGIFIVFFMQLQVNGFRNIISVSVTLKDSGVEFRGVARNGITPDGKMFFKIKDSGIVDSNGEKHCEKINNYFIDLYSDTKSKKQSLGVVNINVFAGIEISPGVRIWRSVEVSGESPQFESPILASDYIRIFYESMLELPGYIDRDDPTGKMTSKLASPNSNNYVLDMRLCGGTWNGLISGKLLNYESEEDCISTRHSFAIMTVEQKSPEQADLLKDALLTPGAVKFITKMEDQTKDLSWDRITVVEAYVTERERPAPLVTFGFYVWPKYAKVKIHVEPKRFDQKQNNSTIYDIDVVIHENQYLILFYTCKSTWDYKYTGSPPDFEALLTPESKWSITKLVVTYDKKTGMNPRELEYKDGNTKNGKDGSCIYVRIFYKT